jgi:hypothetical protein
MNTILAPRLLLRLMAVALALIAVGMGIVGLAGAQTPPEEGTGRIGHPPPQPPVRVETCPPGTPTRIPTPVFTPRSGCTNNPPSGALEADITVNTNTSTAVFTNHSQTCSYRIGLAIYKRFDNNIDNQELYDYELAIIPPNSTLQRTVDNPPCAFQVDAFWGDLILSFQGGVRYGPRLLDDRFGGGGYCTVHCPPQTSPSPTPTCPPATPPVVVTPAWTPGPGCAPTPRAGDLSAVITDHPNTTEARFTNHSNTCAYRIGLATYKRFDNNIDNQELYDWELAVIPPNTSLVLEVDNPPCAYQGDAFWGELILSFRGGIRYGPRLLDDTDGVIPHLCPDRCATPTATRTPAGTPSPTVTGTPPTATNTRVPKITATPTVTGTPPTATPTNTRVPKITATPTVTGTPPTATPTNTRVPKITATPTRTGTVVTTPSNTPVRTGTVTVTPSVTATPCCVLTGVVNPNCEPNTGGTRTPGTASPTRTPTATRTGTPSLSPTATETPSCQVIYQYAADINSTCNVSIAATYFATVEYSNDQVNWVTQATTTPAPVTIQPGLNQLADTFPDQPISTYSWYRIRVTVTLANNCGTFNFLSLPRVPCGCSLYNDRIPVSRPPTDH